MGFIWQLSTPASEDRKKQDGEDFIWDNYARKKFSTSCLFITKKASKIIFFVNDPYDLDVSIKDSEHERQAGLSYVGQSRSVYMKKMMYFQI